MKKTPLFFLVIVTLVLLVSCRSQKVIETEYFAEPLVPDQPFTLENIQGLGLEPATMQGAYCTLSSDLVLIKDQTADIEQGVEKGIVIRVDRFAGQEIYVPKNYEHLVQRNPDRTVTAPFMVEVVGIQTDDNNQILRALVSISNDSVDYVFSFLRGKVQNTLSTQIPKRRNSLHNLSGGQPTSVGVSEYRFIIESVRFKDGDQNDPSLKIDSEGYYYLIDSKSGNKGYPLYDTTGQAWIIPDRFRNIYIDDFILKTATDDQRQKTTAQPKIPGQG